MNGSGNQGDAERREEAARILNRVEGEGDIVASAGLARMARHGRDHFAAADQDADDKVELWATRAGRGLGLVAFIVLAAWLLFAYVLR